MCDLDIKEPISVEKIEKIEKKFFKIFDPPGDP